jgi:hypothetical protein
MPLSRAVSENTALTLDISIPLENFFKAPI